MLSSQIKKIYCLAGLGLDQRLFSQIEVEGAELVPILWEPISIKDTMQSYAAKLAKQIDTSQPFYLMGVSFGGMICVEIGNILKPEKVFLISSCKTRNDIPWYIRILKYTGVHFLFGEKFYIWFAKDSRKRIGIKKEDKELFYDMVESAPEGYYLPATNCIIQWNRAEISERCYHIHGSADKVLPVRFIKNCDVIIEGGEHAMIAYQGAEIAEIIKKML